jgi:hypothetical protein
MLLLGDNINTINKNIETWIDAGREVGLEVNVEKTKYMSVSRHQKVGQNWDIKIPTDRLKMCCSSDIWK